MTDEIKELVDVLQDIFNRHAIGCDAADEPHILKEAINQMPEGKDKKDAYDLRRLIIKADRELARMQRALRQGLHRLLNGPQRIRNVEIRYNGKTLIAREWMTNEPLNNKIIIECHD